MKRVILLLSISFIVRYISAQVDHINFAGAKLYPVEAAPGYITGADFNNDGEMDILVSSILWGGGNLLISNENNQFDIQSNYQDGEATIAAVGDFNNDGWNDYAIVTNQGVRVCTNINGESWTVETYFEHYLGFITVYVGPITLATADFDKDGYIEIAVAVVDPFDGEQGVYLIENQDGILSEDTTAYPLSNGSSYDYLRCMETGDYNGDGYEDIVVSFTEDKKLSILLNDGTGKFEEPNVISLDYEPWMIVSENFNNDSKDDIAICSNSDSLIAIYLSDNSGIFELKQTINTQKEIYSINTADLDADNNIDLFSNTLDNYFLSWKNNGVDSFKLWQIGDIGAYDVGYGLLSFRSYINFFPADFNKDGFIDIAGIFDGNQVGIAYNKGDGLINSSENYEFPLFSMDFVQIADFDTNGWKDILGFDGKGQIAAIFNEGNGLFSDFSILDVQPFDAIDILTSLQSCKIIDFDNDGDEDLVGIDHKYSSPDITGQLNCFVVQNTNQSYTETCHLFLNHADSITERYPAAWFFDNVSPIGTADFNVDGLIDMAFTIGDSLFILHNNDSCIFTRIQAIDLPASLNAFGDPIPFRVYDLLTEDINNDQITDLILNGESEICVYQGTASGQFTYLGEYNHPNDPWFGDPLMAHQMDVADFNSDGYADIAFSSDRRGVSFLLGDPDSVFAPFISSTYWKDAADIVALDIDTDGNVDLCIVNDNPAWQGNSISLLRNEGIGLFIPTCMITYSVGDRPTRALSDDLNNDGLPDIIVQYDWDFIKILLNNSLPASSPKKIYNSTVICNGDSIFAGGNYQYNAGIYYDILPDDNTWDSIITTNLSVLPSYESIIDTSICEGFSYFAQGANRTESGTYIDTLKTINGCDSIIITNLTVEECINATGIYNVVDPHIYPVPTNRFLYINYIDLDYFILYDYYGKIMRQSNECVIDFSNLNQGLYLIRVFNKEGYYFTKRIIYMK